MKIRKPGRWVMLLLVLLIPTQSLKRVHKHRPKKQHRTMMFEVLALDDLLKSTLHLFVNTTKQICLPKAIRLSLIVNLLL